MTLEELNKQFSLEEHVEGGLFAVTHYKADGNERPLSGSIYYYVKPDVVSAFHKIDCDEYWSFNAGSVAEVWVIDPEGKLTVTNVGIAPDAVPTLYVKKGSLFGAKCKNGATEGTFFTCITVPRYLEGSSLVLFTEEDMVSKYPETRDFYEIK